MNGWIGMDLDRTIAVYHKWEGEDIIGEPVQPMVDLVKRLRGNHKEVRIFTARVDGFYPVHINMSEPIGEDGRDLVTVLAIREWCFKHIGEVLPITNRKDFGMELLYDDRAVQVLPNIGTIVQ